MTTATNSHPIVVIGAGPIGLAAAAHLSERGLPFLILEAGTAAGAAIAEWGHTRLFSPWQHNLDACLLYTSPSPRDATLSRMPSSA